MNQPTHRSAFRRQLLSWAAVLLTPALGFAQTTTDLQLSQPIRLAGSGPAYINVSLDALFAAGASTRQEVSELQLGGHDPNQRGFTVQNVELILDGAVDPYLRGQANIIFQLDEEGESFLELEEAFLTTQSLPWNLQVKAGQFFTEFGRLNPMHAHAWDFVDLPLVNARLLGPDGLRNPGARLSWLLPLPFYSELFVAVQNSQGETAASFRNENEGEPLFGRVPEDDGVRGLDDLLYSTRLVSALDLSDTQTLVLGASGAFGPNATGQDERTTIAGADLYWKWKSLHATRGFPFVSLQTELMYRSFEAGASESLAAETLADWGLYAQSLWGFTPGWVAGLRADYVDGDEATFDDPARSERLRISPNLSWFPTEFSKLRLQYNLDVDEENATDHTVWFQFEFLLGAHAAHTF